MAIVRFIGVLQRLAVLRFCKLFVTCQCKIEHHVTKCCVHGFILKLPLHWFRTMKDLGLKRRNECELPRRFPTRRKECLNGFCPTRDVMFRLSSFLACCSCHETGIAWRWPLQYWRTWLGAREMQAEPDLQIGFHAQLGPPANCGTHRVECRCMISSINIRQNFMS